MDNRFDTQSWQLIRAMPVNLFLLVAGADQLFDAREFRAFFDNKRRVPNHNAIAIRVYNELLSTPDLVGSQYHGEQTPMHEILAADGVLRTSVGEVERLAYLDWLIELALGVAYSCGDKYRQAMEEDNFSRVERNALAKVCVALRYPRKRFDRIWEQIKNEYQPSDDGRMVQRWPACEIDLDHRVAPGY